MSELKLQLVGDTGLVMTREFDAPLSLVWAAHAKAEHVKHWWGRGHELDVEMDFRTGGKWRFVEHGDNGERWAFRGEYLEIVPQELIVWTFEYEGEPGQILTENLRFTEQDGRTTITVSGDFATAEERAAMIGTGMADGAEMSYKALDAHLQTMR